MHVTGVDGYTFTGRMLAWGAERAAAGAVQGTGALGPVDGFGLEELTDGCAEAGHRRGGGRRAPRPPEPAEPATAGCSAPLAGPSRPAAARALLCGRRARWRCVVGIDRSARAAMSEPRRRVRRPRAERAERGGREVAEPVDRLSLRQQVGQLLGLELRRADQARTTSAAGCARARRPA